MNFIRHVVVEMDETMVQKCVLCGKTICDYRHTMQPVGNPPPKGFAAGEVFVGGEYPTVTTTIAPSSYKECEL